MNLDFIRHKIMDELSLQRQLHIWRFQGNRIVFTNGCFDLLHPGHIHTLATAADFGQRLVVGLNSDRSIARLKGPHRPLQQESSRALVIAALDMVDAVVLFEEDTPLELIRRLRPDVLVKGGDYQAPQVAGYQEMLQWGGVVQIVPFLPGYSTTALEDKIRKP